MAAATQARLMLIADEADPRKLHIAPRYGSLDAAFQQVLESVKGVSRAELCDDGPGGSCRCTVTLDSPCYRLPVMDEINRYIA